MVFLCERGGVERISLCNVGRVDEERRGRIPVGDALQELTAIYRVKLDVAAQRMDAQNALLQRRRIPSAEKFLSAAVLPAERVCLDDAAVTCPIQKEECPSGVCTPGGFERRITRGKALGCPKVLQRWSRAAQLLKKWRRVVENRLPERIDERVDIIQDQLLDNSGIEQGQAQRRAAGEYLHERIEVFVLHSLEELVYDVRLTSGITERGDTLAKRQRRCCARARGFFRGSARLKEQKHPVPVIILI